MLQNTNAGTVELYKKGSWPSQVPTGLITPVIKSGGGDKCQWRFCLYAHTYTCTYTSRKLILPNENWNVASSAGVSLYDCSHKISRIKGDRRTKFLSAIQQFTSSSSPKFLVISAFESDDGRARSGSKHDSWSAGKFTLTRWDSGLSSLGTHTLGAPQLWRSESHPPTGLFVWLKGPAEILHLEPLSKRQGSKNPPKSYS